MILNALGWYCLAIGALMQIMLFATSRTNLNDESFRNRRSLSWIAGPVWFIAAAMCWR